MAEVRDMNESRPLRILHFSDIHVGLHVRHMEWKQWFSKRAVGAINLLRGRGKYFDDVEEKIAALIRFKEQNGIDYVIHTGDYTALGLESELIFAKSLIAPLMDPPQRYITTPGNHDYYVSKELSKLVFDRHFKEVLYSDMPEYTVDDVWPLVRLIDEEYAIIVFNSARPNPWPWRSNGEIPQIQLDMLKQIAEDERLKDRFVFVATHYAPRLVNGKNDTALHGLINVDTFLQSTQSIKHGAILCGHVHNTYTINTEKLDIYCAGSATMEGHEGFWVYELQNKELKAFRATWKNGNYHLPQ